MSSFDVLRKFTSSLRKSIKQECVLLTVSVHPLTERVSPFSLFLLKVNCDYSYVGSFIITLHLGINCE